MSEKPGEIDGSLIGANASAEGGEDDGAAADPNVVSGVDVVMRARMVETGFGKKKDYQIHIKVNCM